MSERACPAKWKLVNVHNSKLAHYQTRPSRRDIPTEMAQPAPPPSLVDILPAELLVQVAALVDPEDLHALRETCRAMAAAAHNLFGEAFFAARRHIWGAESLQVLVDISAQPSLAKYITSIEFRVVHLMAFCPVIERADLEANGSDSIPDLTQQKDVDRRYKQQEELLRASDNGRKPLQEMFGNLAAIGVNPGISISGDRHSLDEFHGFNSLAVALDCNISEDDFVTAGSDEVMQAVLTMLLTSRLPIRELTMGSIGCPLESVIFLANYRIDSIHSIRSGCRSLKYLELVFGREEGLPFPSELMNSLSTMFTEATSLQHLALTVSNTSGGLALLPDIFPASRLKTLELTNVVADKSSYLRALHHCKQSLDSLILENATMREDSNACWTHVFAWVRDNLMLSSIELFRLLRDSEGLEPITFAEGGEELDCSLEGEDEIKARLDMLAANPEYVDLMEEEDDDDDESADSEGDVPEADSESDAEEEPAAEEMRLGDSDKAEE